MREANASAAARTRILALALISMSLLALTFAASTMASKGPVGFWGSFHAQPAYEGFGYGAGLINNPGGIAINNTGAGAGAAAGDVYFTDAGEGSQRVDQYDQFGHFIRAFGLDVVSSGQHNTGVNPTQTVEIPTTATGGTFRLTVEVAVGIADFNPGETHLKNPATRRGRFRVGDSITGAYGIPVGTTITDISPQALTISQKTNNGSSGDPKLTDTERTEPINFDAGANSGTGAANLTERLEELPAVGPGNVTVTGGPGASGTPFTITFTGGSLAHNKLELMTASSLLVGGTPEIQVVEEGGGLESCEAVSSPTDVCQAAPASLDEFRAGLIAAESGVIDQATGNLFLASPQQRRVTVYGSDGKFQGVFGWGVATGASTLEFCTTGCLQGIAGSGNGQFEGSMAGVAIDPTTGHLFIGESTNKRIQEFAFTHNGSEEVTGASFVRALGGNVVASGPDDTGTGFEDCNAAANPTDVCQAGTSGVGVGQFGNSFAIPLAVDSTGNLYAVDSFSTSEPSSTAARVQKFTPSSGSYSPTIFDPTDLSVTAPFGSPFGKVAIGSGDDVYVAKNFVAGASTCSGAQPSLPETRVLQISAAGALEDVHASCTARPGDLRGYSIFSFALNTASGDFYVPSSNSNSGGSPDINGIEIFGDSEPPVTAIEDVSSTTAAATVEGTINANGPNPAYPHSPHTTFHYEYRRAIDPTWTTFGEPVDIGGGFATHDVTVHIGGLHANTDYEVRLVGSKEGVDDSITAPKPFKTLPIAPTIDGVSSTGVTADSADLNALINPHGTDTEFHFEFGLTPAYGTTLPEPDKDIGASLEAQNVSVHLTGLDGHQTYHYRVVAHSAEGITSSVDHTFNFFPSSCPNSTLRQQTGSDTLPDCRAYELVSPENAGNVTLESVPWLPAPYATSPARLAFGGKWGAVSGTNPTNSSFDSYVATRTPTGWVTTYPGIPGNQSPTVSFGAADLGYGKVLDFQWGGVSLAGGAGLATENAPWVWDVSGASLGRWPADVGSVPNGDELKGATQPSPDFSHLAFSANNVDFDPAHEGLISAPGSAYDYDVAAGTTSLISRTAGGSAISLPAGNTSLHEFIMFPGLRSIGSFGELTRRHPAVINPGVSTDGSHILMSVSTVQLCPENFCADDPPMPAASTPLRLYMRVDDAVTYDIAPGQDVYYVGMAADGSKVAFTTKAQLTSVNSPQDSDSSSDLYLWEENGGVPQLRLISIGSGGTGNSDECSAIWTAGCGAAAAFGSRTTDNPLSSADASNLYFYSPELLDGPANGVQDEQNLYMSHDGDVQYVTTLRKDKPLTRLQISPDGRHVAFITKTRITSYDNAGFAEMYSYDPETGEILCVSCIPSGDTPTADVQGSKAGIFMTDDGRTFFSTSDPLLARDTNEGADVYEFVDGHAQLISPGTGEVHHGSFEGELVPTELVGVSADGINAYFGAFDTLVQQDHNGSAFKFYDARTGGGFPAEPAVAPCEAADECHGVSSLPPPPPAIGSGGSLGDGGNTGKKKRHRKKHRHHHRVSHGKGKRGESRNGAAR